MFKNALIISDNVLLCKEFFRLIQKKKIDYTTFTFSISPFSDLSAFIVDERVDIKVFDLKKQEDINQIVAQFDIVFSIHCKQIFPPDLVSTVKCINVHPGYNPINRGWYPQVFSILHDLPIGATIHEINTELDHGNIIARAFVTKETFDTSETLYQKIVAKEIELLENNLESILKNNYQTVVPENEGNLFLKKDFNNQLELNLQEKLSMAELIDKLRALTHGSFNNAYFIDPKSGKKIYVGISLKPENDDKR